jgi:ParB family chromosome partitioning protein
LERGEERLVAAVESGHIPISLAIEIAKADSAEAQKLLLQAYEAGNVKGKKLALVRRMLDRRAGRRRRDHDRGLGPRARALSPGDLMRIYQREAEKQRILVKKSDFAQARLMFTFTAFKDLLADQDFITLLKAEGLDTMPRMLSERIAGRAP